MGGIGIGGGGRRAQLSTSQFIEGDAEQVWGCGGNCKLGGRGGWEHLDESGHAQELAMHDCFKESLGKWIWV